MKKSTICLVSTFLIITLFPQLAGADWMTEYIKEGEKAGGQGATSYQSGNRHVVSGGSFKFRQKMDTLHPVSITPPSASFGCGGIDLEGGQLSLLDADQYLAVLEKIGTSPAAITDLGINAFCPPCADGIKSFRAMLDQLNAIALDECALHENMKSWAKASASDVAYTDEIDFGLDKGDFEDWAEGVNKYLNGEFLVGAEEMMKECNQDLKDLLLGKSEKSMLEVSLEAIDFKPSFLDMDKALPILVGLIGDFNIRLGETSGDGAGSDSSEDGTKIPKSKETSDKDKLTFGTTPPCTDVKELMKGLIESGTYKVREGTGTESQCPERKLERPLGKYVLERIVSIRKKIISRAALSADEKNFLYIMGNLPLLDVIKLSIWNSTDSKGDKEMLEGIAEAAAYQYVAFLVNSLNQKARQAIFSAESTIDMNPSNNTCKYTITQGERDKIHELSRRAEKVGDETTAVARNKIVAYQKNTEYAAMLKKMSIAEQVLAEANLMGSKQPNGGVVIEVTR